MKMLSHLVKYIARNPRYQTLSRRLGTFQISIATLYFPLVIAYNSWVNDGGFNLFPEWIWIQIAFATIWYVLFSFVIYQIFKFHRLIRDSILAAVICVLCAIGTLIGRKLHEHDIHDAYQTCELLLAELKQYRVQNGKYPSALQDISDSTLLSFSYGGCKQPFDYKVIDDKKIYLSFSTGWYYHRLNENGKWIVTD